MQDEPFFRTYTRLVPEADLVNALRQQAEETISGWLMTLDDQQCQLLHAPYTWTIREVMGHMVDTEIIFAYRALRFSRCDTTPLPGFDEGQYVSASSYRSQPIRQIVEQMLAVRKANICLFEHMLPEAWKRVGSASGWEWSVDDLCRAIIGHMRHHGMIIDKRLSMTSDVRH